MPEIGSPRPRQDTGAGAVVAVLTAAGSGTRLGAGGPKALVQVGGKTLLLRAAEGLAASGVVDHLVVTAPPDAVARFAAEVPEHLPALAKAGDMGGVAAQTVPVQVVAGSPASRQASVALGLQAALAACPDAQVVLVHDAARALTPPQVVRRVVAAVQAGCDAVVPALPVTDTVKEVRLAQPGDGVVPTERVVATPDRSRLRAVQTPQGFRLEVLRRAHELGAQRAADEQQAASDDAALVEAAGGVVDVVAGDPLALKVTTPLDLALAELLVKPTLGLAAK
ncbi:2-C-methyl-D-erythritol 4-phosphate cytidylyltransferase [Actinomyces bovis]|uniref:2-C-methyl-D-erythritol 4-phosphate cytidylyltransferase n=1 Tax=Actinomyces bovis TaxID=1658 RepID=A0ABY1VQ56_9ACTO|nr:2-C-methyl-D-erythritol 4-phosphate cytidylyltransferase [Actinomyces bovis]SPT54251.1 2-C-methyl-D-erythritol 4-phosphate cytidylyltransferase [Actinomyces bovis]VEG56452.1 2-C-methyl-D-erythritol 4-phosphate cytidylyltransferase [Actinomyces israelii]